MNLYGALLFLLGSFGCLPDAPVRVEDRIIAGHTTQVTAEACTETDALRAAERKGEEICAGKKVFHHALNVAEGKPDDDLCKGGASMQATLIIDCE
jgi:hypothetical protein